MISGTRPERKVQILDEPAGFASLGAGDRRPQHQLGFFSTILHLLEESH
jgi:hypothetical protein